MTTRIGDPIPHYELTGCSDPQFIVSKFSKGMAPQPISSGKKNDDGKSRIDLIDPEFLEGVGHVLRFGASKYAAHNWRGGIAVSRLIGAAYRHLGAINRGEDLDRESSLDHVYHLGCCVMFLANMLHHRKDLDDRYKQPDDVRRAGPVAESNPTKYYGRTTEAIERGTLYGAQASPERIYPDDER